MEGYYIYALVENYSFHDHGSQTREIYTAQLPTFGN